MWKDENELPSRKVPSTVTTNRCATTYEAKFSKLDDRKEALSYVQDHNSPYNSVIRLSQRSGGLGEGRLDPFDTFPVHGDADVDTLISHSMPHLALSGSSVNESTDILPSK